MTVWQPAKPTRPVRFGLFLGLGITQMVLTVLIGAVWIVSVLGVAMCTDGGDIDGCNRVGLAWLGIGAALLVSMVGGILLAVASSSTPGSVLRRAATALSAIGALAVVVVIGIFLLAVAGLD